MEGDAEDAIRHVGPLDSLEGASLHPKVEKIEMCTVKQLGIERYTDKICIRTSRRVIFCKGWWDFAYKIQEPIHFSTLHNILAAKRKL